MSRPAWSRVYLGIALTTVATLLLELSLTRIFSVVFYYHFAFLAISICLFGLGAGGVLSYLAQDRQRSPLRKLGMLALLAGIAVLVGLIYLITRPGDLGWATLTVFYFSSALPFLLTGMLLSTAIAATIEHVDRVYCFDLLGAAAGCLLLVPLLDIVGGPNTVLAAGALYALSAAVWYSLAGASRWRTVAIMAALSLAALIAFNTRLHIIDVRYTKGARLAPELFSGWNTFSRIGLTRPGKDEYRIVIDGDAASGIPAFDPSHLTEGMRTSVLEQGPAFPFLIRPGAKALIIGPGGGWDVARALVSGSRDVTAVEINPIIATTIMRQTFSGLSHQLYLRPEVHVFIEDGRSFVRRSREKYQVLQATLVDTWAATAAGAFALSENNLYTSDAFRDYLEHLTDDGLLVFTRWGFDPPRESLRLISLAMDSLGQLGEHEPWKHIVVVRQDQENLQKWGAQDTVLVFRKPISSQDLTRVSAALQHATPLSLIYMPGTKIRNPFSELLLTGDPERFWREYPYDISPVNDDRPFFFYTVQPRDIWNFLNPRGALLDYKMNHAVPLLFGVVAVSFLATAVLLALPLLLRSRLPVQPGARGLLCYFICIGVGYILIQVALIQMFVLLLGHPTYALTVTIFAMLISSGVGSFFSSRLLLRFPETGLKWILVGVAVAVSAVSFVVTPVSRAGAGWPITLKIVVVLLLITPMGFLMGMPFPSGLSQIQARYPEAVRWAWSLNAASSVLGSAAAVCLAIYVGLHITVLIGAMLYLAALAVQWLSRKKLVSC